MELLELVASESPDLLRFTVETMADSPARLVLLKVAKETFGVERFGELIHQAELAAVQLERLERNLKHWAEPKDLFGKDALPAAVLVRFAQIRAIRWRRRGRPQPPAQIRVERKLIAAAGRERSAEMVRSLLEDPARDRGLEQAEKLVRDLLSPS